MSGLVRFPLSILEEKPSHILSYWEHAACSGSNSMFRRFIYFFLLYIASLVLPVGLHFKVVESGPQGSSGRGESPLYRHCLEYTRLWAKVMKIPVSVMESWQFLLERHKDRHVSVALLGCFCLFQATRHSFGEGSSCLAPWIINVTASSIPH